MALSISRPDPASPASIADATFSTARRGFDQNEVREVLREVAAELGRLIERERFLERELRTVRETTVDPATALDDETATRLLGEETMRVLQTARESAGQIKARAEESAARIIREATDEAGRIRTEADLEAARIRSDASADAESELSLAKQQGREMVDEARAYRERVLSELGRRREAARQQIDQLVAGRDRLLQVFERARLVAVDVTNDLGELVEPDEYVNLAPDTGPVPLMVPARPRPADAGDVDADADAADAEEVAADAEVGADADAEVDAEEVEIEDVAVDADADVAVDDAAVEDVEVEDVAVDDAAVEDAEVEDVAVDDAAVEDAAVEDVAVDDAAVDDAAVEDVAVDDAAPVEAAEVAVAGAVADADDSDNVVALFPGDDTSEPDVGGLFARLRAETAAGPERPVTSVGHDSPDTDVSADVAGETIFEARDAELVPLITAAARKLKRVLADEQNDALDTLRGNAAVTDLDALVPAVADHVDRFADAMIGELRLAVRAGAALHDPRRADEIAASDVLDPVRTLVGDGLVLPLRNRLGRSVADGAGDNDDIVRRVRAVYREWKTKHIDDQLDDVLRLAHGVGAGAAIAPGTPTCWMIDPDGPACPDAEDNALAGTVPAGEAFPTGHVVAPAHAGCRCLIAPPAN